MQEPLGAILSAQLLRLRFITTNLSAFFLILILRFGSARSNICLILKVTGLLFNPFSHTPIRTKVATIHPIHYIFSPCYLISSHLQCIYFHHYQLLQASQPVSVYGTEG